MASTIDPSIIRQILEKEGITLPAVSAVANLNSRIAAVMCHSFLLGVIFPAAFKYYRRFPDDPLIKKIYVAVIIITVTLQTGAIGYGLWLSIHEPLRDFRRTGVFGDVGHEVVISLVQPFFILRAYKLTRRKSMLALLILLFLASQATFITSGVLPGFHEEHDSIPDLLVPSIAITVCTDIAITVFLLLYFRGARSGIAPADTIITTLINYTWFSAAPPAIFLLVAFGLAFRSATLPYAILFLFLSGKLYALAFLITQNSRSTLREVFDSHTRGLGRVSLHEDDLRQMGIIGPSKEVSSSISPVPPILVDVRRSPSDAAGESFKGKSETSSRRPSHHTCSQEAPATDDSTLVTTNSRDIEMDERPVSHNHGDHTHSSEQTVVRQLVGGRGGSTNMQTLMEALEEDSALALCGKCGGATHRKPIESSVHRERYVDLEIGDGNGGYRYYAVDP